MSVSPTRPKILYNYQWSVYRKKFLKDNPFCVRCAKLGKLTPSYIVDHITAHKGNLELFWNPANHQALCKQCHDSYKQRLEKSGTVAGCNEKGIPLDPKHRWNRKK